MIISIFNYIDLVSETDINKSREIAKSSIEVGLENCELLRK